MLAVEALYFLATNLKQRFLATLPGAVLAVGCWLGLSYLLGMYFRHFANFNKTYGTLGAANVPRTPNERKAPRLGVITSAKTLRTRPLLSRGKNRDIMLKACSRRLGTGKYATTADKEIRDVKSGLLANQ